MPPTSSKSQKKKSKSTPYGRPEEKKKTIAKQLTFEHYQITPESPEVPDKLWTAVNKMGTKYQVHTDLEWESCIIVTDDKGNVVGACGIGPSELIDDLGLNNGSFVHFFFVRDNLRRMGVGRQLLEKIIDFCKNQGQTSIWTTITMESQDSMDFWTACGFKKEAVLCCYDEYDRVYGLRLCL